MIWRFVDNIGYLIGTKWGPVWQLRTGVSMIFISIAFFAYLPVSGESVGIFLMSALALLFTAPVMIAGAVMAINASDDDDLEELSS